MDQTTTATVAEVEPQACYVMSGITYVPHYMFKGMYAGPGGIAWPESYLQIFGAERVMLPLWPRKYSRN